MYSTEASYVFLKLEVNAPIKKFGIKNL